MTPTPQCQFVEVDWSELKEHIESKIAILDRFKEWARYFGIKTALPQVQKEMKRLYKEGLMPVQAYSVWRAE
jgi:hypothetical protein